MIEEWRQKAKCRGTDPSFFFPERGMTKQVRAVQRFCEDCPVKQDCLDYASAHAVDQGMWGGEGSRGIRANRRRMGLSGVRHAWETLGS